MSDKNEDCKCSGNSIVRSNGEYTILVIRSSFTIQEDLPYPIWGTIYLKDNSFASAIKDYLPAGITCTSSVQGGYVILHYSDGTNTDNIVLLSAIAGLLSYPEMLSGLNTNYLKTELAYFCNNAEVGEMPLLTDQQNQLFQSKPLYLTKIGALGNVKKELITPVTRKIPNNSVSNIIELSLRKQDIKPDTVWIHTYGYLPTSVAGYDHLVFYWQIIINEFVNMNKQAFIN